jgi:hypothetical protein
MPDLPEASVAGSHPRVLVTIESLLAELAARFPTLPAADVEAAMADALRRIANLADVDCTQCIRFERPRRGEIMAAARLEGLPEAVTDKAVWQRYGVKSERVVPLGVDGSVVGAIVLDCDRPERSRSPDVVEHVRAMTTPSGPSARRNAGTFGTAIRHTHSARTTTSASC